MFIALESFYIRYLTISYHQSLGLRIYCTSKCLSYKFRNRFHRPTCNIVTLILHFLLWDALASPFSDASRFTTLHMRITLFVMQLKCSIFLSFHAVVTLFIQYCPSTVGGVHFSGNLIIGFSGSSQCSSQWSMRMFSLRENCSSEPALAEEFGLFTKAQEARSDDPSRRLSFSALSTCG